MKRIPNIHPGEILEEDFLSPMGITPYRLAKETGIGQTRVSEIIHGKRSITMDSALRFAKFFGNSPEFWINLQMQYDLEERKKKLTAVLQKINRFVMPVDEHIKPRGRKCA
jgi:addiction module HigA family antidote